MEFINMEFKHNYTIKEDNLIEIKEVMEEIKVISTFKK